MDGNVSMVFKRKYFPKMTDFSKLGALQAVMHTEKVVGLVSINGARQTHCYCTRLIGSMAVWPIYSCHFQ